MRVAIYGCGQLAAMMATESEDQGHSFCFIQEPNESTSCVDGLGDIVLKSADTTAEALYIKLGRPDVITVERESVPVPFLKELEVFCPVHPNPEAVKVTQNRAREKTTLADMGIPVAPFRIVQSEHELKTAISALGLPVFVKTVEDGYDGKGQWKIDNLEAVSEVPDAAYDKSLIVEQAVPFKFEMSLIGVRGQGGDIQIYPVAKNTHLGGILYLSIAPFNDLDSVLAANAKACVKQIMEHYAYVGALAIEFFVTDDEVLVNELAPRVHNSGHWTMSGAESSQFENHIRAVTGMNILSTAAKNYSAMINLIGTDDVSCLRDNASSRLYGKSLRAGRKMGHVNINCKSLDALESEVRSTLTNIYGTETSEAVFQGS